MPSIHVHYISRYRCLPRVVCTLLNSSPLTTPPCCLLLFHIAWSDARLPGGVLAGMHNEQALFPFPSPTAAAEEILASRSSLRPHTHTHTAHMLSHSLVHNPCYSVLWPTTYIHIEYIRESPCACCRPPAVLSRCSAHSSTLFSFAFLSPGALSSFQPLLILHLPSLLTDHRTIIVIPGPVSVTTA